MAFFIGCHSYEFSKFVVSFYSQDSSLLQSGRSAGPHSHVAGQLYSNAMYTENSPSQQKPVPMYEYDHYLMSSNVSNHTYESISDDDLRAQYNGEYSLLDRQYGSPSNSQSTSPSEYDKLVTVSGSPSQLNDMKSQEEQGKKVDPPSTYDMLEIQSDRENKPYSKLQRKGRDAASPSPTKGEDYDQIHLPKITEEESTS